MTGFCSAPIAVTCTIPIFKRRLYLPSRADVYTVRSHDSTSSIEFFEFDPPLSFSPFLSVRTDHFWLMFFYTPGGIISLFSGIHLSFDSLIRMKKVFMGGILCALLGSIGCQSHTEEHHEEVEFTVTTPLRKD